MAAMARFLYLQYILQFPPFSAFWIIINTASFPVLLLFFFPFPSSQVLLITLHHQPSLAHNTSRLIPFLNLFNIIEMVSSYRSVALAAAALVSGVSANYNTTLSSSAAGPTVTVDCTTNSVITTTVTYCTRSPHCATPVETVFVTDCPVVYPGESLSYEYTTYATVTGDKTVTVTEPCSTIIPATVTPKSTIFTYTVPGYVVTPTTTASATPSAVTITSYTTYTSTSSGSVVTVTEPCEIVSYSSPVYTTPVTYTAYTTYSKTASGAVVTVTEPCASITYVPSAVPVTVTSYSTYSSTSSGSVVTVTEPCETAITYVVPTPSAVSVTSYTTYTSSSSGSVVTVTEPCSTVVSYTVPTTAPVVVATSAVVGSVSATAVVTSVKGTSTATGTGVAVVKSSSVAGVSSGISQVNGVNMVEANLMGAVLAAAGYLLM